MAFKLRPPKPEEAKAPEKGPKPYKLKKFVSDMPPHPSEFDEYARRLCVVEKWIADRKRSGGELYRRLEYLEATMRKEGNISNE